MSIPIPRTRERITANDLTSYSAVDYIRHPACTSGYLNIAWSASAVDITTAYESEVMEDVDCGDTVCSREAKKSFHPVKHTKVKFTRNPGLYEKIIDGGKCGDSCESYYLPSVPYPIYGEQALDWSREVNALNMDIPIAAPPDGVVGDAFQRMRPSVQKILGDSVNIYEILGELKHMHKLLDFLKVPIKGTPIADAVGGKYLGYRFGVKPVISTIQSLHNIASSLDKKIDLWNKAAYGGKTFNFHETVHKDQFTGSYDNLADDGYSYAGATAWDYTSYAHVYFKPNPIPDHLRFKIKFKAYGFHKPLTALWELTPWSWAVDYFLGIQDKISAWEESLSESLFTYDVVSAGYSIKSSRVDILTAQRKTCNKLCGTQDFSQYSVEEFERIPLDGATIFTGLTTSGISFSLPSPDQAVLLLTAAWLSRPHGHS